MTAFLHSQIPQSVNTLEELVTWATLAMRELNGALSIVEAANLSPERVVQAPLIETQNNGVRHVFRICIEMDPAYASDRSRKYWTFARELTVGNLPNGFWTQD